MDGTVLAAFVGLGGSALLAVLGIFGRRYEGRESRAVSTQGEVIDDLKDANTRLRGERDEARAAHAAEVALHKTTEQMLWDCRQRARGPELPRVAGPLRPAAGPVPMPYPLPEALPEALP